MGQANSRLERMKRDHPKCCFYGGTNPTETVEHAPPKVFFIEKRRPNGHEFPACERCNGGSASSDQIAALVACSMASVMRHEEVDAHIQKLAMGVFNNQPEVISEIASKDEDVFLNQNGILLPASKITLSDEIFDDWLDPWAAKIGCALWFENTAEVVSENHVITVNWITNHGVMAGDIPKKLFSNLTNVGEIRQGKWSVSNQFRYHYALGKQNKFGAFFPILFDCAAIFIAIYENIELVPAKYDKTVYQTNAKNGIHPLKIKANL